jgi:DNA-binding transcriptional LysR family regulator
MEYINLNHLKYFYVVAQKGSYTLAAESLLIQQPALSKTVRSLEETMNCKLFERAGRGVKLTPAGTRVYEHCHLVFQQIEIMQEFSQENPEILTEPLSIGCSDIVSSTIIPSCLTRYKESWQGFRPHISTGPGEDILKRLTRSELDLAILFHLPPMNQKLKVYRKTMLPFRLVISAQEYSTESVRTSFIGSREVDDPSNKKFPTLNKMRKYWPQTKIRISSSNQMSHLEMVRQGLGVAILPLFIVRNDLKTGRLRSLLDSEKFEFALHFVINKSQSKNKQLQSFIQNLEQTALEL